MSFAGKPDRTVYFYYSHAVFTSTACKSRRRRLGQEMYSSPGPPFGGSLNTQRDPLYQRSGELQEIFGPPEYIGRNCQREGKFPRRSRVISRGAAVLGSGINGYRTSGTPNFVCRAQTRPDAPTSIRLARPYKVPPGIARGHRLLH